MSKLSHLVYVDSQSNRQPREEGENEKVNNECLSGIILCEKTLSKETLVKYYGNSPSKISIVKKWRTEFWCSRTSTSVAERSACATEVAAPETIEKIHEMVAIGILWVSIFEWSVSCERDICNMSVAFAYN